LKEDNNSFKTAIMICESSYRNKQSYILLRSSSL